MRLIVLWLHVLGVVVWIGGLVYQAHVLMPLARRGQARAFAEAVARGRTIAWIAASVVVLTGFSNVTRLGPLERVMESGAGLMLAGKFVLVIAAVALAGQRDFGQVPRLRRALAAENASATATVGDLGSTSRSVETSAALAAIAWLDRLVLALAVVIVWLGLAISRA